MADEPPRVLVIADPKRVGELAAPLLAPLPSPVGVLDVSASTGGDDAIELFRTRGPSVVVITASLEIGDTRSLLEALRELAPRTAIGVVVIGDDDGPIRTPVDAAELAADRFVSRPLAAKALRFAVQSSLEMVALRVGSGGGVVPDPVSQARTKTDKGTGVGVPPQLFAPHIDDMPAVPRVEETTAATEPVASPAAPSEIDPRAVQRARWTALADRIGAGEDDGGVGQDDGAADSDDSRADADAGAGADDGDADEDVVVVESDAVVAEYDAVEAEYDAVVVEAAVENEVDSEPVTAAIEAEPLPPPVIIQPRRERERMAAWEPGSTEVPAREPTLIIREPSAPLPQPVSATGSGAVRARPTTEDRWPPAESRVPADRAPETERAEPPVARVTTAERWPRAITERPTRVEPAETAETLPAVARTQSEPAVARTISDPAPAEVDIAQRGHGDSEEWSRPVLLRELASSDESSPIRTIPEHTPMPIASADVRAAIAAADERAPATESPAAPDADEPPPSGDFARRLREKMSQMAQRLFQYPEGHDGAVSPAPVDLRPHHGHKTEIDLAALGEDEALDGDAGEPLAPPLADVRELATSPGSWDTHVRERGLPDAGEIVRGISDAAMLLAKLFAQQATGRIRFRRDDVEKIVFVDAGRPVFASSNEPGDRMGELLVREGKITAAQYERCQADVAESGRRMGEILVEFGYLKRRELLPAVRRHVEDVVYSVFAWDRGQYHVTPDPSPSGERIRLSRHPASLVLEGIRRKLDRSTLERLVGPPSTIIELRDRERLGGILTAADLGPEERAAIGGCDGQADLGAVARATGIDIADVLPLAWGLYALGLATLRRADAELEEVTALVGETDLAIDRERVRARWRLVTDADYFALLGVRRDATAFEIRRAYQAARKDFAADGFPADLRREMARELDDIAVVLDEAFRVLRDDRLRGTYLANLID